MRLCFFNIAHYALRPWPWILIALASLVIYPNISDLQAAFPNIPVDKLGDDLAYSAMLTYLPTGLIGIVLASLIAAVMSTLSTHLNWGSSYIVNDFYLRFMKPEASDKELVAVGRISTVLLMVLSAFLALAMSSALDAFEILLQIGAGTGLIFILRWFWWRINAYTEISAMAISFVVAIFFEVINPKVEWILIPENQAYLKLVYSVLITTVGWLAVTFLTQPEKDEILLSFYRKVTPAAFGWKKSTGSLSGRKTGTRSATKGNRLDAHWNCDGIFGAFLNRILYLWEYGTRNHCCCYCFGRWFCNYQLLEESQIDDLIDQK